MMPNVIIIMNDKHAQSKTNITDYIRREIMY